MACRSCRSSPLLKGCFHRVSNFHRYSDWCRCILRQNIFGCFWFGPGPVRLVALLLWRRNASLAGGFAGRPCVCFCGFVWWFALLQVLVNWAVYPLFDRLCRYQDRATEHLRPNSRKKKLFFHPLPLRLSPTCRRGWRPSISNRVPRDPAILLDLQKHCGSLKPRQFWQKRSLQQSHFRGRKHISFLDS